VALIRRIRYRRSLCAKLSSQSSSSWISYLEDSDRFANTFAKQYLFWSRVFLASAFHSFLSFVCSASRALPAFVLGIGSGTVGSGSTSPNAGGDVRNASAIHSL
jgi:hypothetical protein